MESVSLKKADVKRVSLKGVIIKQVSSPATIASIAESRSINPQEVFVRVTFEYEGKDYTASNKLRIFTQKGYEELLKAKAEGTPLDVAVTDTEFIYLEKDVSVADLFKVKVEVKDTRSKLDDLFA